MKKTLAVAAAMAAPAAMAGELDASNPAFEAAKITHTGSVHVDALPEHAFPLFTAPGERLWVPGWDPVIVGGGKGLERGSMWLTTHGDEQTIWLVVDYDPAALHARYARITPGSRGGTVEVFARPDGSGATEVQVTYELTALSTDGNEALAAFDAEYFSHMMVEWERMIQEADIVYPAQFD
jgi:hypothetical protein